MNLSLRSRPSDDPTELDNAVDEPPAPTDPRDDFWSPYMTRAEAALRVPGLAVSTPVATSEAEADLEAAAADLEETADEDAATDADDTAAGLDQASDDQVTEDEGVDAAWRRSLEVATVSATATSASPTLLPPPPPALSDLVPAHRGAEAGTTAQDDHPYFTTREPEPITRPLAAETEAAIPEPEPDANYPFFTTPEPQPIAAVDTTDQAPAVPVVEADTSSPFFTTPEPQPIAAVDTTTNDDTPTEPDTNDSPFFTTNEPQPIAAVDTTTNDDTTTDDTLTEPDTNDLSTLPPPPPMPAGERLGWSLQGTDPASEDEDDLTPTESVLPPPPPLADGDDGWSLQGQPAPTATADALFAPDLDDGAADVLVSAEPTTGETAEGTVCPTCGSAAKIDLIDRQRGLQHLSCVGCYRVWQTWMGD